MPTTTSKQWRNRKLIAMANGWMNELDPGYYYLLGDELIGHRRKLDCVSADDDDDDDDWERTLCGADALCWFLVAEELASRLYVIIMIICGYRSIVLIRSPRPDQNWYGNWKYAQPSPRTGSAPGRQTDRQTEPTRLNWGWYCDCPDDDDGDGDDVVGDWWWLSTSDNDASQFENIETFQLTKIKLTFWETTISHPPLVPVRVPLPCSSGPGLALSCALWSAWISVECGLFGGVVNINFIFIVLQGVGKLLLYHTTPSTSTVLDCCMLDAKLWRKSFAWFEWRKVGNFCNIFDST